MYRTPEIVDLYSNFPISEKQDIWVRPTPCVWLQGGLRGWATGPWPHVWPADSSGSHSPFGFPSCSLLLNFFKSCCDWLEEMDE